MKNLKKLLVIISLLTTISTLHAQPPGGFMGGPPPGAGGMPKAKNQAIKSKFLDIAYANKSAAEKLDIYLPDEGKGPFPVIVSIHGGAFAFGDKADGQVNPMLEGLKRGYVVVSLNYRMSGEAKFPAPVQDVKAAIRFIRANAGKYHLNPDKIAAWGGSAGGNLASMLGTTGDVKDFDDASLGNAATDSKVQAVVDWFGPIQFDQMDAQFKETGNGQPNHGAADSPESRLLGAPVSTSAELVKRASPASYISKNDPPFFIEVGTKDPMVPTQQSKNFYAELKQVLG
ncbi:MAG: alpha/beta hydrolase, partial [Sphingobacteriaceae bacterium]